MTRRRGRRWTRCSPATCRSSSAGAGIRRLAAAAGAVALIAKLTGGGELAIFRLAAAPCLAAAAVLGVWLAAASRRMGRARSAGLLALVVCVANPLTFTALKFGHPEELLGGVLCVAAVLAAGRGRPVWLASCWGSRSPTRSGPRWRSGRCRSRCPIAAGAR